MNKFFWHILAVGLMMLVSLSCSKEQSLAEAPKHGEVKRVDNVALSFTIKADGFGLRSSALRSVIVDGAIEHGEAEGTENENKVNNLWVFLFDNSDDKLKYMYEFRQDATDTEYKLTGPFEQIDNMYQTPVKLVKPGRYTLVISANTYQHRFRNDHISTGFGDPFTANMTLSLGMKRNTFGQATGGNVHFVNSDPAHDRDPQTNGLNASFVNYNFIVPPNYTSKKDPFVVPVHLSRPLSKLVVTMTNIDENGNENITSRDYKLVEAVVTSSKLYKLFLMPKYKSPIGAGMNTAWYSHAILPLPGNVPYNVRPNNGLMKDKFPLLKKLNEEGFTERLEETELFNYYIPPWAIGSTPQTENVNTTKLKLVFEHKTNGNLRAYEIPLYDIVNGQKVYTIQHNTLYRLRLSFRGRAIRSVIE